MADIAVLLPDGSRREVPEGSSLRDVAAGIGSRLAKAALAGVVNGAAGAHGGRGGNRPT
ncbi:MAG: TGS domain-containing protein, partial [Actinomycetes bacterium]